MKDIKHRQNECDYIYDKYFESQLTEPPQKTLNLLMPLENQIFSADDEKYLKIGLEKDEILKAYWNGSRTSKDESSNDMGLMSKLMYWCNNNIDFAIHNFKNSPYAQKKDYKHAGKMERADYLQRTAEKCIHEKTAQEENIQFNSREIQDLMNKDEEQAHIEAITKKLTGLKKQPYLYSRDDKGNGELFSDVFKDELHFDTTANQWRYFNSKYWQIVERGLIASRWAKLLQEALLELSLSSKLKKEVNESVNDFRKHILNLGKKPVRDNMLKDAKDKFPICKTDLDKDIYLLNCQNGTLDLKTFEFRGHRAEDFISKISNVRYDSNASNEIWKKFILEVMKNDNEKVEYLQKAIGYSLTGATSLETCFILYGETTRNGKSTLTESIKYLLGDYAMQMNPETLAKRENNSKAASGDIARLDGIRFLNVSEPSQNMILDEALIKKLTGRDTITARKLYESEFEFIPEFKLFMNTNHLPQISDNTVFSSGRINVITFDKHFTPEEQDIGLKDKLKTSEILSGILNWCIEGLKMFNETGLKPPQSVINSTSKYKEDSDDISRFMNQCLITSKNNISAKEVYENYSKWCDDFNISNKNKQSFFEALRNKNILKLSGTVNGKTIKNIICGYSIAPDWLSPQGDYYNDG